MKVTEPSSAIKQLKRKFGEIQESLNIIEEKQHQYFYSVPDHSRPSSAEVSPQRPSELEKENKRLLSNLQKVTRERDELLEETRQLKATLAARNKVISQLTLANERFKKEQVAATEVMPYMPMNLYDLDEAKPLTRSLREKRNLLKSAAYKSPAVKFSEFYQEKSSHLARQLLGKG